MGLYMHVQERAREGDCDNRAEKDEGRRGLKKLN